MTNIFSIAIENIQREFGLDDLGMHEAIASEVGHSISQRAIKQWRLGKTTPCKQSLIHLNEWLKKRGRHLEDFYAPISNMQLTLEEVLQALENLNPESLLQIATQVLMAINKYGVENHVRRGITYLNGQDKGKTVQIQFKKKRANRFSALINKSLDRLQISKDLLQTETQIDWQSLNGLIDGLENQIYPISMLEKLLRYLFEVDSWNPLILNNRTYEGRLLDLLSKLDEPNGDRENISNGIR